MGGQTLAAGYDNGRTDGVGGAAYLPLIRTNGSDRGPVV
jgi:hypothetical protein